MKRLTHQFSLFAKDAYKKFMRYEMKDRLFISYLLILAFFILFMPIFSIEHEITNARETYYLLGSFSLFKSFVFVTLSLVLLFAWNMSLKAREFLSVFFGVRQTSSLLNFSLLFVIALSYFGMGDVVNTIGNSIPRVSMSSSYIIIQILLFGGLVYMLWLTVDTHKNGKQMYVFNEQKETETHDEEMDSLFASMKEKESHKKKSFDQEEK